MFRNSAGDIGALSLSFLLLPHAAAASNPATSGNVDDGRALKESGSGENWLVKGGGFKQQQFSPLKQITSANIAGLGLAWSVDIPSPMGLSAEPMVVDGAIYLSAPQSLVYAIDAGTGANRWTFDPHVRMDFSTQNSYAVRANRGVAVWAGKVYVATGDCRLIAIDAGKGVQVWEAQICDPHQTGTTDAPRVARGRVFVGYNGSDDQVRGSIVAFDAETGKEAWRFWTVPGDPAKGFESKALERAAKSWSGKEWWWHGGGDVWTAITFDADTGLLLFGTATAHTGEGNTQRETSGGAKLFSGCIVAVNADSGEYAWHFQTSTAKRQSENFHIVLADITIAGRKRHVAMTVPRNGSFYVLDAKSGKLISDAPMVRQGWADLKPGEPARHTEREGVEDCEGGGCFAVHNWWPMSYSPVTQLTYVPIMDRRRSGDGPGDVPFVGRLMAWDAKTQSMRWSVEHPIAVNSGVLSTAGNLVFQGQGTGEFAAYAADSGTKVWSLQTGSAIDAVPVSFSLKGEQYVIVPVGWGSALRLFGTASMMATPESKRGPSRLLAFKLGANTAFPYPHVTLPGVPRPPPQNVPATVLSRGKSLYEGHLCSGCHSPGLDGSGAWVEGGAIPDLRYMPEQSHRDFYATVIGGAHRAQGMMPFGVAQRFPEITPLTMDGADAIHAYVIDESWKAYKQQNSDPSRPLPAH